MSHPEISSSGPATHIDIDMPPPGVGVRTVVPPTSNGNGVSIVLKRADSGVADPSYKLDAAGLSAIGIGVTMSDGCVLSGTVPAADLKDAVEDLNNNLEPIVHAELSSTVDPLEPDPEAVAVGVMIDGILRLTYNSVGIGTVVWGYNLNLEHLTALVGGGPRSELNVP